MVLKTMQLFPLLEADFQVTCPVTGRIIIPFCSYWESGTEPELPYTLENVVFSPRDPTVVPPSICACVFSDILQFSVYKIFVSLVMLSHNDFILYDVLVGGIIFFISLGLFRMV